VKKFFDLIYKSGTQKSFFWLSTLFLVNSGVELLCIALIGPYMSLIFLDTLVFENENFINFLNILNSELKISFSYLIILAFSLKLISTILNLTMINYYTFNLSRILRNDLILKYMNMSIQFAKSEKNEKLLNVISNSIPISCSTVSVMLKAFSNFFILLAILIFLSIKNFEVVIISVTFLTSLIFLYFVGLKKKMISFGIKNQLSQEDIIKNFKIIYDGLVDIKIFNSHNYFLKSFNQATKINFQSDLNRSIIEFLPRILLEFILVITIALIIIYLFFLSYDVNLLLPLFGTVAYAIFRLMPISLSIGSLFNLVKLNKGAIDNFSKFEDLIKNSELSKEKVTFNKLEFKNFNFSFPNSEKKIFENFNAKINLGDNVFLSGKSGSGKTTLLNIILGIYETGNENFFINDEKAEKKRIDLQSSFYIAQKPLFFRGSIKENIKLGLTNFKDNEIDNKIYNALEKTCLNINQNQFKNGINTLITDNASNISGGQLQRICLARLFIFKKRNLIILDEATNALDKSTEEEVLNNIFEHFKNSTIILTSHRQDLEKYCNKKISL